MVTLAFNIIARDGAKELKTLIPEIQKAADEVVVVVDDRTKDDTMEVCKSVGATPYWYKWTGGFKDARNFGISKTKSQYIAWTDCDDRLPQIYKLQEFKKHNTNLRTIYTFKVQNMPKSVLFAQVRMFPNHPEVRFVYRIHETIDSNVTNKGFKIQPLDMIVQHWGYSDQSKLKFKLQRNLPEMEAEIHSGSFCPSLKFTYAMNLRALGKWKESDHWFKQNINNEVKLSAFRDVYLFSVLNLAKSLVDQKQYTLAEHYIAEGLMTLPDFKEFHLLKSRIFLLNNDYMNANAFYELAKRCPNREYAVAVDWSQINQAINYCGVMLYNP
jgi:glycosyltransferase involved in cell wall biosynthesis